MGEEEYTRAERTTSGSLWEDAEEWVIIEIRARTEMGEKETMGKTKGEGGG